MSDLPEGWASSSISEVAEVNPRRISVMDTSRSFSFVPMAAVDELTGTIVGVDERSLDQLGGGFTQFIEGDVLLAKITPSMENGKAAIATNLVNGMGYGSTEFHVLRPGDALDAEYLWRFVRQLTFRAESRSMMSGAVGQLRVPAEYIKQYMIPVPPLAEQKRIVAKVASLLAKLAGVSGYISKINQGAFPLQQALLRKLLGLADGGNGSLVTIGEIADAIFDGPFGSNLKSADYTKTGYRVARLENLSHLEFLEKKRVSFRNQSSRS